jgi:hypothetical protein
MSEVFFVFFFPRPRRWAGLDVACIDHDRARRLGLDSLFVFNAGILALIRPGMGSPGGMGWRFWCTSHLTLQVFRDTDVLSAFNGILSPSSSTQRGFRSSRMDQYGNGMEHELSNGREGSCTRYRLGLRDTSKDQRIDRLNGDH